MGRPGLEKLGAGGSGKGWRNAASSVPVARGLQFQAASETRCNLDDVCWLAASPRNHPCLHLEAFLSQRFSGSLSRAHLVARQAERKSHDEPIYRADRTLWLKALFCDPCASSCLALFVICFLTIHQEIYLSLQLS